MLTKFNLQGFKRILYTPDEVAQIIMSCVERLMKNNEISKPFPVAEIQGGVLKTHLIEEDYLAPHKVTGSFNQFGTIRSHHSINYTQQFYQQFCVLQQKERLAARRSILEKAVREQEVEGDSEDGN